MSERIVPAFTADGKAYKIVFSRTLQVKYKEMFDEKRKDTQYQQEIVESERLKTRYEAIHKQFEKAETEYFADMLNEDKEKIYIKAEQLNIKARKEYSEYVTSHASSADATEYTLYVAGQLVLLGLETQYEISKEKAEEVWNKYVEEVGDMGAMKYLLLVANIWFADTEADNENPFIKAVEAKAEQAKNRREGLAKITK